MQERKAGKYIYHLEPAGLEELKRRLKEFGTTEASSWLEFLLRISLAELLEKEGADAYAVASVGEGLQVRRLTNRPVLVLGYAHPSEYPAAVDAGIELTVSTLEMAQILSEFVVRHKKQAKIHIKVETGMERIGFAPTIVNAELIRQISRLEGIEIAGFFTHFARSDEQDKSAAKEQMDRMLAFLKHLPTSYFLRFWLFLKGSLRSHCRDGWGLLLQFF